MIALYLRLSMADGDLGKDGKDESNSIENQRKILRSFIEQCEDLSGEIVEYIDDGYSGTNFERPGFKAMLEDMKTGQVKVMLTKDLSRLGRNYIEVGDYMDQIFPLLGVRYIAVNSNYDSNDYLGNTSGLDMSLSNLVNSMYSKDLSKKLKSAVETRWKNGYSTSGRPTFGYVQDPDQKGKWIIEPVAAAIVRKIYDLVNEDKSIAEIVEVLNKEHVLTPGQYREKYGFLKLPKRRIPDKEWLWNRTMVWNIFRTYENTGALVQSKMKTVTVGSKIRRTVPLSDRFIIENHHEPIVSKEEYDKARTLIHSYRNPKGAITNTCDFPLIKIAYCGNCGLKMDYTRLSDGYRLKCRHKARAGKASTCSSAKYPSEKVAQIASQALRVQLELMSTMYERLDSRGEVRSTDKTIIKNLEKRIENIRADKTRAYELYAERTISKELYIRKRDHLKQQLEELEKAKSTIKESFDKRQDISRKAEQYLQVVDGSVEEAVLNEQIVDACFERILFYDEDHIEIVFKFDDLLKEMQLYA